MNLDSFYPDKKITLKEKLIYIVLIILLPIIIIFLPFLLPVIILIIPVSLLYVIFFPQSN
jgi:hypothetical protein